PTLFNQLESESLSAPDPAQSKIQTPRGYPKSKIERAILVKRRIVEADPYESGERALLNLGHTFGHAFAKCTGYIRLHGFAVAQGMVAAFRLARRLDMCEGSDEERLRVVLHNCGRSEEHT